MKPHHEHAAPSKAVKGRAPVSCDIGPTNGGVRVRLDGTSDVTKGDVIRRLVFLWNMHEGIPIEVLEAGAVRSFYNSVHALIDAFDKGTPGAAFEAVAAVKAAWAAIAVEPTADGKRANCPCSEKA